MDSMKWKRRCLGVAFTALFSPAASLAADDFPRGPVRIVVGMPVGSSPDVASRTLADEMQVSLGQPLVVENRPGAGGTLATALVADAPPDGHTLNVSGCSADAIVYGYLMSGRPALDPFKDFTPVGQLLRDHWVVLVPPLLRLLARRTAAPRIVHRCGVPYLDVGRGPLRLEEPALHLQARR